MLLKVFSEFVDDETGQGITEYAAILAFIGVLVAFCFGLSSGTLMGAISQSFSSIIGQLDRLNSATYSIT